MLEAVTGELVLARVVEVFCPSLLSFLVLQRPTCGSTRLLLLHRVHLTLALLFLSYSGLYPKVEAGEFEKAALGWPPVAVVGVRVARKNKI